MACEDMPLFWVDSLPTGANLCIGWGKGVLKKLLFEHDGEKIMCWDTVVLVTARHVDDGI